VLLSHRQDECMSNVDANELARFAAVAQRWWDPLGEMRPLHDLNPVRLSYVEQAMPLQGRLIVDVGCGGGLLSEAMAQRGAQVTGLDLSAELLEVARQHARETPVAVDYRLEAAEAHAVVRPAAYDIVTCMEMLEHVPDPAAIVAALSALTAPDGHVFVSTINRTPRAYALAVLGAEYLLRLLPRGTHTYEKFIRPSELAAWGRAAGLELVDVAGLEYDPFERTARLVDDARVNYLMHLRRPAVERDTAAMTNVDADPVRPRRYAPRHRAGHGGCIESPARRKRPRTARARCRSGLRLARRGAPRQARIRRCRRRTLRTTAPALSCDLRRARRGCDLSVRGHRRGARRAGSERQALGRRHEQAGLAHHAAAAALDLDSRAACVVSGDTVAERKPHPLPLLHAAAQIGVDTQRCVYVGDAQRDIQAGRAARMTTVAAAYGYVAADEDLSLWSPHAVISDPRELLGWIAAGERVARDDGPDDPQRSRCSPVS
jgi:2-polyprenyl-6-hydroxyphenyl methylase/3-demethylubiquinone-9 3-methyltransferase